MYFFYFVEKMLTSKQFQVFPRLFTLCRETHRTTLNYSVFIYLWFFLHQRKSKEMQYSLSLLNLESVSLVEKNIKLKDFRVATWEFLRIFFSLYVTQDWHTGFLSGRYTDANIIWSRNFIVCFRHYIWLKSCMSVIPLWQFLVLMWNVLVS